MSGTYPNPTFSGVVLQTPLPLASGGTGGTNPTTALAALGAAAAAGSSTQTFSVAAPTSLAHAASAALSTISIATIGALHTNTIAWPCISLLGYSATGDGGEGVFLYNSSDTTSGDDGGTIIIDAAGHRYYRAFVGAYNVKWFGAVGNGSTPDHTAINNCLLAAPIGAMITFPPGTYFCSQTLQAKQHQQLLGLSPNTTMITRTGNYGDTLFFANGGACRVEGIFFNHSTFYTAGETSLPNLATTGAHIHIVSGQWAVIRNTWAWRMPYGFHLDGCFLSSIRETWTQGVWDEANTGCQEGIANIWLDNATANGEIIKIESNYINGAKSAMRSVTYTATDGTQATTKTENIGSKYGILVYGVEDLCITNNFIGALNQAGLYTYFQSGSSNLDWRIVGNFFDDPPTSGASIYFNTDNATSDVNGVTITGNVFNGELIGKNAILEQNSANSANPALVNFTISGNTFQAYVGSCIGLYGAVNGIISGNNFTGYNGLGVSAGGDVTFAAAVYLANVAKYVNVSNNQYGGAPNTGVPGGSYTYLGVSDITTAGLNQVSDNSTVGIGASLNQTGLQRSIPKILTVPGNYQASSEDSFVVAMATQTAAWSFGLPPNPVPGDAITIKDGNGSAATHNVQIVGTVDGTSSPFFSTAYFCKTLRWNGTQWNVIASA